MKGAVKKSKMERGKKKSKTKRHSKAMKYQGKGKTECRIVAKQRTQRNSTRKNCHPKLFKEKKKDIKDISKATERKANKQRRKETKAKRESHEAMQSNAKQRYERKTKEQSKAPEKQ